MLYSTRSQRHQMEQASYTLLYCWCIGLSMDDVVCKRAVGFQQPAKLQPPLVLSQLGPA